MKIRNGICAATTVAAVAVAAAAVAAPSSAAPAPAQPDAVAAALAAGYRATTDGGSMVATITDGSFTIDDTTHVVALRDTHGAVKDTVPLAFAVDGQQFSIDARISADGRSLRMTPQVPPGVPSATAVASPLENQLAMNDLINSVSFGLSAGSLIGTVIGAVIGVGAGLAVSGASCVVLSIGCVLAVVPIVTLLGGVGGLAGLVLGGAPGLAAGLWNYYTTMQAAPGHSKYADQLPGFNQPEPADGGAQ
ncbi:hypothetical protein ACFXG4_37905 [Nocardia sp. NPDC059246]|uniref:hypothetical protein n=1 Tax=unclassified Nocardia TaxID=2637762 RepID=UPI003683D29F